MWRKPLHGASSRPKYLLDDVFRRRVEQAGNSCSRKRRSRIRFDKKRPPATIPRDSGYSGRPGETYSRTPIASAQDANRSKQEIEQELDAMQQIGVKWIRSIWRWDKIEWNQGKTGLRLLGLCCRRSLEAGHSLRAMSETPRRVGLPPRRKVTREYHSYPPKKGRLGNLRVPDGETTSSLASSIGKPGNETERPCIGWERFEDLCELQKTALPRGKTSRPLMQDPARGVFPGPGLATWISSYDWGAKDCFDVVSIHPLFGQEGEPRQRRLRNQGPSVWYWPSTAAKIDRSGFTEIGWPDDLAPGMDANRRAETIDGALFPSLPRIGGRRSSGSRSTPGVGGFPPPRPRRTHQHPEREADMHPRV